MQENILAAEYIIKESIAAVLPDAAVKRALERRTFDRPPILVAIGKAAWRMAKAAYDKLEGNILRGVVITKYEHSEGPIGPLEIYEAAQLDSSSASKTFFKITLPMLTPQLFMLLITITTGSFKVFDSIRIMTNGGPGTSTTVLCMFIYEFAFNRNNSLGMGAAGGVMLMLILILITLLDFKSLEKKVHYQ